MRQNDDIFGPITIELRSIAILKTNLLSAMLISDKAVPAKADRLQ